MLVYIADQDNDSREKLARCLLLEDWRVGCFSSLGDLENAMLRSVPSTAVLDLSFPTQSCFAALRSIKRKYTCPVVVTDPRGCESDQVISYELGSDDYLPKPYSVKELSLRLDES